MHFKRGPLTCLHGRFLITFTMPNRIVEFSLKFYRTLHCLSVLYFINVRLVYLHRPRFLSRKILWACNGDPLKCRDACERINAQSSPQIMLNFGYGSIFIFINNDDL